MKLRNNFEVGDRILILHANTKNQLRKDDVGKIGTILDKRCSFCIVHLDGDDRDKNYNYGTFAKVTGVYLDKGGSSLSLDEAMRDSPEFNTVEEALEFVEKDCTYATNFFIKDIIYDKRIPAWRGLVVGTMEGYDSPQCVNFIRFKTQTYSK